MTVMWRFQFLGNLRARRGDAEVILPARKYTSLLACLLLHADRRWSRDELIARFWPDSDDATGRAALRTALSALKKNFGAELFDISRSDTISVHTEQFTTDVAQFDALIARASQWASAVQETTSSEARYWEDALLLTTHGPLLPGLYEDWVVSLRAHIEAESERAEKRLAALRQRIVRDGEQRAAEEALRHKAGGPLILLPLYNTPMIGREAELKRLGTLLRGSSGATPCVITLTGPGGTGKTRLSVEAATRFAARFSGAVCFVPLAALTSSEDIGRALVSALEIEAANGADPLQNALFRLDDMGASLLILDNMEQLVEEGAASVVRTILARLPQATLLITSRRPIGVEGEHELPIAPLDREASHQLFLQHARATRPDYGDGDSTLLPILCERLEGIPLAIELCAPWVRVLTEAQMLQHLDKRFRLLVSRRRDVPTRHRSLHAALEWGCPTAADLLAFFTSLSIFRGGFTLAAAEAVGGENALEHLAALQEQSLVLADRYIGTMPQAAMRYRLLETIREFAGEKLTSELASAVWRRALQYFKRFSDEMTPRLLDAEVSARYFAALEVEASNFRAVIEWGLEDTPESVLVAHDLIRSLRWFWWIRGHKPPLDEWRRKACKRRDEVGEPHRTYLLLQHAIHDAPDTEKETLLRQALETFHRGGEESGVTLAHECLAIYYREQGEAEAMEAAYRTAAQRRRESGDLVGYGYILADLAGAFHDANRVADARPLWAECREISVTFADKGSIAVLDRAAGSAFLDEGKIQEAVPLLESAAATFRQKDETWQLMHTLWPLGQAYRLSERENAAREVWEELLLLAQQCGDAGRVEQLQALLSNDLAK